MYLKVSPECQNYSIKGNQAGSLGLTGWQLPDIAIIILEIEPLMIQIENSSNVVNVNNGEEIARLKQQLSHKYVLHFKTTMKSYDYGDNVHSHRFVCIGCHINMGTLAHEYKFPDAVPVTDPPYCARDIADPDTLVPRRYWQQDNTKRLPELRNVIPGNPHYIASAGKDMGPPECPNKISSWEGATPRPTKLGGGIRHPKLSWILDTKNPVGLSRTATIHERVKCMSAPPDTVDVYAKHDITDKLLVSCIGNGISCMMATAIDDSVRQHCELWLQQCLTLNPVPIPMSNSIVNSDSKLIASMESHIDGITGIAAHAANNQYAVLQCHSTSELNIGVNYMSTKVDTYPNIRSALVDTGANRTFLYCETEKYLQDSIDSKMIIQVADASTKINGSKDGKLAMLTIGKPADTSNILKSSVTTVNGLHRELLSIDEHFLYGINILLKCPDYEDGIPQLYKPATDTSPEIKIPLRYEYNEGGFWLDYIPLAKGQKRSNAYSIKADESANTEHNILMHKHMHDMNPSQTGAPAEYLDTDQATKMVNDLENNSNVTEVFHSRHAEEREFKGVKAGLRKKKRDQKAREFHEDHMHMGDCPGCPICIMVMGNLRRIYRKVDPYKETRPAHTFHMDTITWSHRAFCGSKYEIHVTCGATRWPDSMFLYSKSEALHAIESWIIQMRLDPMFQDMPYKAVQVIVLDNAGEWDINMDAFKVMIMTHSIELKYTSKDRKESNAVAERAIGIKEPKVKAGLLQTNLPPMWWVRISKQVNWLLARFPPQTHNAVKPPDGDLPLPLELITRGRVSRRMIYNQLYYFVAIGTPALVHDAVIKGSRLPTRDAEHGIIADCKSRFMVAWGMYQDQVIFWDPRTNDTSRSKSYTAFRLRGGMNFSQIMGIPLPKPTSKSAPMYSDFAEKVVIQLPEMRSKDTTVRNLDGDPITRVIHRSNLDSDDKILSPTVTQTGPQQVRGSVDILASDGERLMVDTETGWLITNQESVDPDNASKGIIDPNRTKANINSYIDRNAKFKQGNIIPIAKNNTRSNPFESNVSKGWDATVCIEEQDSNLWDQAEAHAVYIHHYVTGLTDTFIRVCKQLKLPMEWHTKYKTWCLKCVKNPYGGKLIPADLPMEKNDRGIVERLKPNWLFPYPSGSKWITILNQERDTKLDHDTEQLCEASYAEVCSDVAKQSYRKCDTAQAMVLSNLNSSFKANFAHSVACTTLAQRTSRQKVKKPFPKRAKRKRGGNNWPTSVKAALASDKPEAWLKAIAAELDKLTDRGVFKHNQTLADIKAHGIIPKPVPLGLYLTEKHDENGDLLREKARAAIKGHSGNMQKGVHYFETYAATPQPETARVLICIAVKLGWKRRAWDVELAYAWADLPVGERLALAYPKGCERFHPETGEILYIILLKNLYGDPAAARRWSIYRDSSLLETFNTKHICEGNPTWTCRPCDMDPCLFHITLSIKTHTHQMLVSIHTDDLDAIGSSDFILDEFYKLANGLWTLKRANENFMLGIERIPEYDDQGTLISITCKMRAFVKGAVAAFSSEMPAKPATTPYPPKDTLTKDTIVSDAEVKLYQDKGYARVIGLLLWAVRHGFDECKYGMSILGSVASKPGKQAWRNAMHMLSWIEINADRGIRFNNKGNFNPVVFADASDKKLTSTGQTQAGFVIMWMDGPLITSSFRLKHVGLSIEHNEYMAITAALKKLVWLTQLLDEIRHDYVKPINLFGDNVQANRLCNEQFISSGNQYIDVQYHFNKEKVREGLVTVQWVDTNLNLADIYTKPLERAVLDKLMPTILGYGEGIDCLVSTITAQDPTSMFKR